MSLLHWKRPFSVLPIFNKKELTSLIKIGFPLFIVSYVTSFVDTIPRLYLLKFGSIEQLGLFSPIIIMLSLAVLLPNSISSYMYPKMSFQYGISKDKNKIWQIILLTLIISFISSLPLFLLVYFLSDYVYLIFPKYSAVSPYLKIASFSILFIGHKSGGISFSVLKSWWMMILNGLIYFIITLVSISFLHYFISDVLKVAAISIVISFGFMFFLTLYLSFRVTHTVS
jgi:O-antigen/teichoic acid export membrane protein